MTGAAMAMAVLTMCTTPSPRPSGAPLRLQPVQSHQFPQEIDLVLVDGGEQRPVMVDTGSVYLFLGNAGNDTALDCPSPSRFTWGSGKADFCSSTMPLRAVGTDGSTVELSPDVTMGRAVFADWVSPNYAILGLSANLVGTNVGGLTPVVDQLRPDYLSFRFPDGPLGDAVVAFAPLPDDEVRDATPVALVSPGGLGYGYTSKVSAVDFLADGQVLATIRTEADGVYLEKAAEHTRIADTNLAFFDTGATPPYVPLNGDISLLGDQVPNAIIPFAGKDPYDEVRFTLDAGNGQQVVISKLDVQSYAPGPPFLTVPSVSDFPEGLRQLTSVVGLGTLSGYDFHFTFADGKATTVQFSPRRATTTPTS